MNSSRMVRRGLLLSASMALVASGNAVRAQNASGTQSASVNGVGDIIVTARKRDETSISVPVAITAVSAAELDRRAISNLDGVARAVPSLIVGEGGGTVQGGIVAIRGLSGADNNPMNDQAVSFNIDGVQVARASVRRLSEMDVQQIEVLKGPQALFFGKNSPGGVISVRSADPTKTFQGKISTGYEFYADETRTEGYLSGPITNTLGFRVAGYFSNMLGYARNVAPQGGPGIFGHDTSHIPDTTEYAIRGTLKFEPSDRFNARLKVNYNKITGSSVTANDQLVSCPLGHAQNGAPVDNCTADNKTVTSNVGPNFGKYDSRFGNGHLYSKSHQVLAGLEMNYNITDELKLTSVTGYYDSNYKNLGNFTVNYQDSGLFPAVQPPAAAAILASYNALKIQEITEEARLASSFDAPINFVIGGLYQHSKIESSSVTGYNALTPFYVNNYYYQQIGNAYSFFGQALWDIVPTLELAAGARYSHESKRLPHLESGFNATTGTFSGLGAFGVENLREYYSPTFQRNGSWHNISPEATLTWRPTNRLTLYGSYKQGFLSGGFSSLAPAAGLTDKYNQQTTKGFEGGIKALLLNGALRTNLAIYTYKTSGLQVGVTVQGTQQVETNVGAARTSGAEFDFTYRTPIKGLTLNGAVDYNKGKYLDYQASCYRGESSALCYLQTSRVSGATALLQDLSGTQLVRAPKWTGNLGFDFERPINDKVKFGITANGSHSDSYFTDTVSTPGGLQKGYELYDASVRVGATNDRWEVALIGRNLGNKYYIVRSSDNPGTGSAPGAALVGTLGDTAGVVSRGREIMLRLTVAFGG